MNDKHRSFLESLFPGDAVLFEPEQTHVFTCDASRLPAGPSAGLAVVRPRGQKQVVELLKWAQAEKVSVYPRGRATNVVGACIPGAGKNGAVVVSMLNMDAIVDIDAGDFVAEVEPGVVTGDLQARLAGQGLFYPPDPASASISTIGGNLSTGAGGLKAVKYGVTKDYVLGLTAVLPGGKVLRAGGRCHKNVVGLDLARLFVGSEGTLGIVTRVVLKLLPLPQSSGTVLAAFSSLQAGLDAAQGLFRAGLVPTALEFLDATTAKAVAVQHGGAPWTEDAEAVLFVRADGDEVAVGRALATVGEVCAAHAPNCLETAQTPDEEEPLWELRRSINPASFGLAPDKISDDITVPRSQVGPAVAAIQQMARERQLKIMVFGHLGDGNLHVNIMHDASDPDERKRAETTKAEVLKLALELGGTLSGEHGVGLTKLAYLNGQLSGLERSVMAGVKRVFDPAGIMNPGKAY